MKILVACEESQTVTKAFRVKGHEAYSCDIEPCSGARWFKKKQADGRQQQGIDFFLEFTKLECSWVIENPVGVMSTCYRKPDQIIQPYFFGDSFEKQTCIWLNNLPKLVPTNIVTPEKKKIYTSGKTMPPWYADTWGLSPKERAKARSKTFKGVADAMADQWG